MPHRQPTRAQVALDRLGKLQEAQTVGDRAAVAADPLRQLLLRPLELRQQLLVGLGLVHRVQVLAEQVLDQGELQALTVGRLPKEGRDPFEPGELRGPPPSLAGDELIALALATDDDRLNQPGGPYRGGKL